MQGQCSLCGQEVELVEAIGDEEIISICKYCADKNNFPIIKKPTIEQVKQSFSAYNTRKELFQKPKFEKKEKSEIDKELEKIVAKNLKPGEYKDLVDNFHWHIQHTRRLKKISQKQLAESIAEPEIIIAMAEKSQLPSNYEKIISKLEQFLGIRLKKSSEKEDIDFNLEKINLFEVKTSDLKQMQNKQTKNGPEDEKSSEEEDLEEVSDDVEKKKNKSFWQKLKGFYTDEEEPIDLEE